MHSEYGLSQGKQELPRASNHDKKKNKKVYKESEIGCSWQIFNLIRFEACQLEGGVREWSLPSVDASSQQLYYVLVRESRRIDEEYHEV